MLITAPFQNEIIANRMQLSNDFQDEMVSRSTLIQNKCRFVLKRRKKNAESARKRKGKLSNPELNRKKLSKKTDLQTSNYQKAKKHRVVRFHCTDVLDISWLNLRMYQ